MWALHYEEYRCRWVTVTIPIVLLVNEVQWQLCVLQQHTSNRIKFNSELKQKKL